MTAAELHHLVSRLFAGSPARTPGVGIEQELVVRDQHGATVPVRRLRSVLCHAGADGFVGFEPGGQLELSLPPSGSPEAATRLLHGAVADVREALDRVGVTLHAVATDPRPEEEVPMRLRSARYLRMQQHFDTVGPAGRRMMRRTASTQVCLDWWPGDAGAEQWRVLQLAAPHLAATFARDHGPSSRLATWLMVDPTRTAFDGRLLRGDPVAAYARFAAGATPFVDGTAAHLTTLFPPVRPRGSYLEVRFLDALEGATVDRAVAVLASLAFDDRRRRSALRRLEPGVDRLADAWAGAATGDESVVGVGRELVRDSAVGVAA